MKTCTVTNKHSGIKYTLTINHMTKHAYVLEGSGPDIETIWETYWRAGETCDDFIKRAKQDLMADEDM